MTIPTNLRLDGLSFEQIKNNFKTFMKGQDEFRDYNFESSGINTLIDILSYNTYYNSFYQNMMATENFLSTAQRRNSAVNLAKALNYVPRSVTSSTIIGDISCSVVGAPASIDIPAYTKFVAVLNGTTYNFLTKESLLVANSAGSFIETDVELVEGEFVSERYVYDVDDSADKRFLLTNPTADTSTLTVRVQDSATATAVRVFTKTDNIVSLTSSDTVYFLEEVEDGKYQVKFGDGILGTELTDGNVIYIEYIVSSGAGANGIKTLEYASSITDVTSIAFTVSQTETQSFGGQDRETIESIKFSAPKSYASQNRAITTEDYESLLLKVPNVGSVIVWGGEDNVPPAFGKVFVAIRPTVGEKLTATEKKSIIDTVIKPKKVLTVATEIVDAEYVYIIITAAVKYDPNQTIQSSSNIKSKILETIVNYKNNDLNQFSKYFRESKLTRLIDTSERSILSTTLTVKMQREVDVQLNSAARYTIDFSNPINAATDGRPASSPLGQGNQVTSNEFSHSGFDKCFLEDNNGIIRIFRINGPIKSLVLQNVGTINYTTGAIVLIDFSPTAFENGGVTLKVAATPADKDILPLRGQIITIRDADIKINVIDDNLISLTTR